MTMFQAPRHGQGPALLASLGLALGLGGCNELQKIDDGGSSGAGIPDELQRVFDERWNTSGCHDSAQAGGLELSAAVSAQIIDGPSEVSALPLVELGNVPGSYLAVKLLSDTSRYEGGVRMPFGADFEDPAVLLDNAIVIGWLATIEWGTALAPVYKAHAAGIPVHVWVSETRPRNQGTYLTAWELQRAGVPCTIVTDNACGQLLRSGAVDCVLVGSDRTAANGDVCNKIGTYLKALAAGANGVPFYALLPASTIDWECAGGDDIPIENRAESEVLAVSGADETGQRRELMLAGSGHRAHNPAFDVTPAALVTALVTEYGSVAASSVGLERLRAQISSSSPM